jgi:hypothetical protein
MRHDVVMQSSSTVGLILFYVIIMCLLSVWLSLRRWKFMTHMIKMHHRDCVSYLLMNDHVVVEWCVEYKVTYDIQWQEDMHMWQSMAWSILVCGCNCINVPKKQCWCLHCGFVVPKCWETKYNMLLQMVNVQNFDAKIYQHVIK